jgi:type I restriction enzyme S subunit
LVPQDPNDEPASELLKKIAEEKAKLVLEGKIKKQRPLPSITEEEKPFILPEGWAYERIGNLVSRLGSGSTPRGGKNAYVDTGIPFFRSQNIWNDGIKLDDVAYITKEVHEQMSNTKVIPDDVLLNITGASLGRSTIFPRDLIEANVSQHVTIIRLIQKRMKNFLHLGILSPLIQKLVWGRQVGMAIEGLSKKVLELFEFPVPPLKEQHRIVAKVDELMALCDQLETQTEASIDAHKTLVEVLLATLTDAKDTDELNENWQAISQHFDVLFTTQASIDQLKQTILQLAVMGKLVKQDPKDEPASKLLERIATEKQQLIKDGKIKKQKPLPSIAENEKPFELPKGWEWSRLPDIGELARGKSKHRPRNDPSLYVGGNIKLVQTGDVANANRNSDVINTFTALYNSKGLNQSRLWPKGTMCITIAANIADTGILGFDACFPDSVVGFTPFEQSINVKYFEYFIRTAKSNLEAYAPATAQKNINLEILGQLLVPLPPLNELNCIVLKVVALMDLCDSLKANLNQAQTTQLHLTDAIVEQVL